MKGGTILSPTLIVSVSNWVRFEGILSLIIAKLPHSYLYIVQQPNPNVAL